MKSSLIIHRAAPRRRLCGALLVTLLMPLGLQVAQAQTNWLATTDQDFGTATNWSNGVPSGTNGGATWIQANADKNGSTYPILSSGTFSQQWGDPGQWDSFYIGAFTTSDNRLDVTGGSLAAGQFIVSPDTGGDGNVVNLSGTGSIESNYWFIVGRNNAIGEFNMSGGTVNSAVTYDHTIFGNAAGSNAGTLDLSDGTFNVGGDGTKRLVGYDSELWVGENGTGVVTQTGGTMNSLSYFVVGRNSGSNGDYNQSAGVVNAATGGGHVAVGVFGGATGSLDLSGTAEFNAPIIYVGESGTGTMTVADSVDVNLSGSGIQVGRGTGSVGTYTQTGGTVDTTGGGFTLGRFSGASGTATISGGTMTVTEDSAIGHEGTGELTISGTGTFVQPDNRWLLMGAGGGTGTLNLDADGTLEVRHIEELGTGSTVNLNGGTIRVNNAADTLFDGDLTTNVLAGGVVIDTNTLDKTVGSGLVEDAVSMGGGLTKQGDGALTLDVANTYTGATLVSGGTLVIDGGTVDTSSSVEVNGSGAGLVLANGGSITPTVTITQGSLDGDGTIDTLIVADDVNNTLTTGNGGAFQLYGTSLTFQGAATLGVQANGTSEERYFVYDNLTTTAPGGIVVNATNASGFWKGSGEQYTVIDYSGGSFTGDLSHFTLGTLDPPLNPMIQTATLVDTGFEIVIEISGDPLGWTGEQSADWTTTPVGGLQNWVLGGSGDEFESGDAVLFDDNATLFGVNIADADVSPSIVVFENTFEDYTISSTGGFGIGGTSSVVKNGSGQVTISTNNSYTGSTAINDGIIEISGTGSIADSSSISLGEFAELIFNISGPDEYANPITGSGAVTSQGTGPLTLSGANTFTGDFTLEAGAGQLNLNSAGALGAGPGVINLNSGTLDNTSGGTVNLAPDKAVNLSSDISFLGTDDLFLSNGGVTLDATRTVNVPAGATLGMGAPDDLGGGYDLVKTGDGTLVLNGGNLAGNLDVQGGIVGINQDFFGAAPIGSGILQNDGAVGTKWIYLTGDTVVTSGLQIRDNDTSHMFRLGIVKRGTGSLTLTNASSSTSAQLQVESGTLVLQAGTYKRNDAAGGTLFNSAAALVGTDAGENGILVVDGATVDYDVATGDGSQAWHGSLTVATNGTGAGAVKLASGSLSTYRLLAVGWTDDAFAGFTQTGGTANIGGFIVVGFGTSTGVMNLESGTFNHSGPLTCGTTAGGLGIMNIRGDAVYNNTNDKGFALWIAENGNGTLNVADTAALNLTGSSGTGLVIGANGGSAGTVNLLGGTVTGSGITKGAGAGMLNFNGGTLAANTATATFLTGLDSAYVHSGGGVIDNGGNAITIGQALLAPTGGGVSATGLSVSGGGCIDTPVVTITGDGTGATAVAVIDANGDLTGITITNPGIGYTTASVALSGGGIGNTAMVSGTPAIVANTSGGMTFTGNAVTTLGGVNKYTGDTSIDSGTTVVVAAGAEISVGPTANGVSSRITGAGTISIDGKLRVDASGADIADGNSWTVVDVTTPVYNAVTFGVSIAGVLDLTPQGDGVTHVGVDGNNTWTFSETTGVLSLSVAAGGYATWADANLGGQSDDQDYNGDGVQNGIAYFMNDTGIISLPGIVGGSITWTNGGNIDADQYGTEFVVQTSTNLTVWSDVPVGELTTNTDGPGGELEYTLPTGMDEFFVRLKVTPN